MTNVYYTLQLRMVFTRFALKQLIRNLECRGHIFVESFMFMLFSDASDRSEMQISSRESSCFYSCY